MIVTLVFDRKAAADFLASGSNHVRVVDAGPGTAMLRFHRAGSIPNVLRRTRGGGAALRLSGRSSALLVRQAAFAGGDRLRLERTSYRPVAASKAVPDLSARRLPSVRICITDDS